jgi:hypothetical protein
VKTILIGTTRSMLIGQNKTALVGVQVMADLLIGTDTALLIGTDTTLLVDVGTVPAESLEFSLDSFSAQVAFGSVEFSLAAPLTTLELSVSPGDTTYAVAVSAIPLTTLSSVASMGAVGFLLSVPIEGVSLPITGGQTGSSQITFTLEPLDLTLAFGDTGYAIDYSFPLSPFSLSIQPQLTFLGYTPFAFSGLEMPITFGNIEIRTGSFLSLEPLSMPITGGDLAFAFKLDQLDTLAVPIRFAIPVSRRLAKNQITKLNLAGLFSDGTLLMPEALVEGDAFGAIVVAANASEFGVRFNPESYAIPANTTIGTLRLAEQGDYVVMRFIGGLVCITDIFDGAN